MTRKGWLIIALLLLSAWGYVALVAVPQAAIAVERSALTTSPADVGLEFEDFAISPQDTDLKLAGWWMPATACPGKSGIHSRWWLQSTQPLFRVTEILSRDG